MLFETTLLAWNFGDASFWRGAKNVSMAEVISLAKSIALTRFREDTAELVLKNKEAFVSVSCHEMCCHFFEFLVQNCTKYWKITINNQHGHFFR